MARKNHIGETALSRIEETITIIEYVNNYDISVRFEDGTIMEHARYYDFKHNKLWNPSKPKRLSEYHAALRRSDREGMEFTSWQGQKFTIKEYKNAWDVTVEFEDGTVVEHKAWRRIKEGHVKNPNFVRSPDEEKIGMTNMAANGHMMRIIAYRNANDIDIEFDDGVVVRGRTLNSFKKGSILHPDIKPASYATGPSHYVDKTGEETVARCGLKMTIIRYGSSRDIDVMFEDGYISKNRRYQEFKKGLIKHNSP